MSYALCPNSCGHILKHPLLPSLRATKKKTNPKTKTKTNQLKIPPAAYLTLWPDLDPTMINAASSARPREDCFTAVKENTCMLLFFVPCFSRDWRAVVSKSDFLTADMHSYCMKYGRKVKYKTGCKKKKKKKN